MTPPRTNVVKQQVAAHWDRRAPRFDDDFGHSIRTPAERAAWDRILDLVLGGRSVLHALDAGCGTGFLAFELAARGHHVTGVDFAPAMLAEARRKATARGVSIRFEEADAEQLPFMAWGASMELSRSGEDANANGPDDRQGTRQHRCGAQRDPRGTQEDCHQPR